MDNFNVNSVLKNLFDKERSISSSRDHNHEPSYYKNIPLSLSPEYQQAATTSSMKTLKEIMFRTHRHPFSFYNILLFLVLSLSLYWLGSQLILRSVVLRENNEGVTYLENFSFGLEEEETSLGDSESAAAGTTETAAEAFKSTIDDASLGSNQSKEEEKQNEESNKKENVEIPLDWMKAFTEKFHPNFGMFSPEYLDAYRSWATKQEREIIQREMEYYEYQTGNETVLDDLIMEKGGQPIRNIIFTTWRSGSTFLGETLAAHPGTFYHYEPLLHFGINQVRKGDLAKEGIRVLDNLLHCNFTNLEEYMAYGQSRPWLFNHNTRVWQYCRSNWDVCWDPKFLSYMCRIFPFQSVKTVRMRLRLAKTLLQNENFNIRLLLLVRDPRGTIQSRNHRDWCPEGPDCYDPSKLCLDMLDDFSYAEILRRKYPDRFLAIRYEDVSLSPYESMQKIFKFFRLHFHPQVVYFLNTHTTANEGGVSSTFRDSKTTPFHWRNDFVGNFSMVTDIQNSCKTAMKVWGYEKVTDPERLLTFNPLKRPPWPEMIVINNTEALKDIYAK